MRLLPPGLSPPHFVVYVLGVNLDAKGNSDLLAVLRAGVFDVHSSPGGDFSLIREKCTDFSTSRPSNTGTYSTRWFNG